MTLLKMRPGVNNECFTPKWIFDKLNIVFDLDVAAPEHATNVPCKHKFTQQQNGLMQTWFGNVWCNPPYSKPLPWVNKFQQHGHGIALLPTTIGKWQLQLWSDMKCKWVMLEPIKFEGYKLPLPTRCYLIAYGNENINALHEFGVVR